MWALSLSVHGHQLCSQAALISKGRDLHPHYDESSSEVIPHIILGRGIGLKKLEFFTCFPRWF